MHPVPPLTAAQIIAHYHLRAHPEGGHYAETYRSAGLIPNLPAPFSGPRAYSTTILFLLQAGEYSHLHRIRSDEGWHFYLGGPLRLAMISPTGTYQEILLGQNLRAGQHLQYTVPAGTWFGATPAPGTAYALVGCTVAPGFDFQDFELASGPDLTHQFPTLKTQINEFAISEK